MTREEYIVHRNNGAADPLYHFYLENYKGDSPLNIADFFKYIQQWPPVQQAFYDVMDHYDRQFMIMKLSSLKTGEILKYF